MIGKLASVAGAMMLAGALASVGTTGRRSDDGTQPATAAFVEPLVAPPPAAAGFQRHRATPVQGHGVPDILLRSDGDQRLTLAMVGGSVCEPALQRVRVGDRIGLATGVPVLSQPEQDSLGVHIAVLERRGLRSLEAASPTLDADVLAERAPTPCTDVVGGVTLEQRVADVGRQLDYLDALTDVDGIVLVGSSEGADVAAAAAVGRKDVRGLILLAGTGVTQLFDMLQLARAEGERPVQAQLDAIDSLLDGRGNGEWMGLPEARWRSYAIGNTPLQSLLRTHVPVMVVHGVLDDQVPIASADAAVLELVRQQPDRPVFYWSLPDVGHALLGPDQRPLASMLIAEGLEWMSAIAPPRILRHAAAGIDQPPRAYREAQRLSIPKSRDDQRVAVDQPLQRTQE